MSQYFKHSYERISNINTKIKSSVTVATFSSVGWHHSFSDSNDLRTSPNGGGALLYLFNSLCQIFQCIQILSTTHATIYAENNCYVLLRFLIMKNVFSHANEFDCNYGIYCMAKWYELLVNSPTFLS